MGIVDDHEPAGIRSIVGGRRGEQALEPPRGPFGVGVDPDGVAGVRCLCVLQPPGGAEGLPGSHGSHETEDFQGTYALWAIPFSLAMLVAFLVIVVVWVPSAATREMRAKEVEGARSSRELLEQHRAAQREALASGAMPIEAAIKDLAAKN